jgi:serine/threonine protein kinase
MPSRPLEPGDPVRLGRFELLGRLGEGGQGVVYLGRGTNLGEERVAVKILRSTVDANVLERLARELDAIHQVQPFVTAGVAIDFTFVAGARTAHEDNQDCVNTLTLTSATDTTLVFSEPQTANCVAGTATFTRHGSGLAYRWTDNIEQNTATLSKT